MGTDLRFYTVFDTSEISIIDFSEVLDKNAEMLPTSANGKLKAVKWIGNFPSCLERLKTARNPLTQIKMLEFMSENEWCAGGKDVELPEFPETND